MRRHSTADRVWSCRCRTAASAAAKSPRNPATVRRTQPYDSSRTPRRTRRSGRICPPRPAPIQYFQPKTYQKTFAGSLVASTGESPNFNHIFHIPTKGRHRGRSHGDGLPRRPVQAAPETVMKGRRVRVVSEANDRADRCGQETNRLSQSSQFSRPSQTQASPPGPRAPFTSCRSSRCLRRSASARRRTR